MNKQDIQEQAEKFCKAHGLVFVFGDKFVVIGQSGFDVHDIDGDLQPVLDECLREHNAIEAVVWKPGLLYEALENIHDGPTRAAIEDELTKVLDKPTLDKVARVFYKYTKEGQVYV